jgi:hypothetical protein
VCHAPDFHEIGMHDVEDHVVAGYAQAHAFAEIGPQPRRLDKRRQPATLFAQLTHKGDSAGGLSRAM